MAEKGEDWTVHRCGRGVGKATGGGAKPKCSLFEYTCGQPSPPPLHPQISQHLALPQVDGEVDELGVLLHQLLQLVLLQILPGLLLHHQGNGGATLEGGASGVLSDGELLSVGCPDVLLVIVVLGRHYDRVSN